MAITKFCSVADAKGYLNIASDWSEPDAKITAFIKSATALIRAYTRRDWEKKSYTEYFATADAQGDIAPLANTLCYNGGILMLTLGNKPITPTVDPVVKYSVGGRFADVDPLVKDTDYYIDYDKNALVFYPFLLQSSPRSIQVVYSAGYAPNGSDGELLDVDENLKTATAIQAAFMYSRMVDQENGQSDKGNSRGSARFNTKPNGLCAEAQAMVKGYVKLFVGR